jgi:predicted  nucleic acid-binding Zn-ribbon protein
MIYFNELRRQLEFNLFETVADKVRAEDDFKLLEKTIEELSSKAVAMSQMLNQRREKFDQKITEKKSKIEALVQEIEHVNTECDREIDVMM